MTNVLSLVERLHERMMTQAEEEGTLAGRVSGALIDAEWLLEKAQGCVDREEWPVATKGVLAAVKLLADAAAEMTTDDKGAC